MEYQRLTHTFPPIFDHTSKVLILGTFPSVKSREHQFYYGHPQNRFWKILGAVMDEQVPGSIVDKKSFLLKHHIAIWDVIASCDIIGSSDSTIKNVIPSDLTGILKETQIRQIYTNGAKAWKLYQKYSYPETRQDCIQLPSSSPANAAWQLERLISAWSDIRKYL